LNDEVETPWRRLIKNETLEGNIGLAIFIYNTIKYFFIKKKIYN
jgi:hypothetical protein